MANQANATANAATVPALEVGKSYNVSITGFTYIKDWAAVRGNIGSENVTVIIGDKLSFGMQDMFQLKHAGGIRAKYSKDKEINGTIYRQFQLEEILF